MSDLKKEFVSYDLALILKSLSFEESCFAYYESQDKNLVINYNNLPLTEEQKKRLGLYAIDNRNGVLPQWAVAAPTWRSAFEWFRDKHNLSGIPTDESYEIWRLNDGVRECIIEVYPLEIYEEAELACLEKLIEIIESKSK